MIQRMQKVGFGFLTVGFVIVFLAGGCSRSLMEITQNSSTNDDLFSVVQKPVRTKQEGSTTFHATFEGILDGRCNNGGLDKEVPDDTTGRVTFHGTSSNAEIYNSSTRSTITHETDGIVVTRIDVQTGNTLIDECFSAVFTDTFYAAFEDLTFPDNDTVSFGDFRLIANETRATPNRSAQLNSKGGSGIIFRSARQHDKPIVPIGISSQFVETMVHELRSGTIEVPDRQLTFAGYLVWTQMATATASEHRVSFRQKGLTSATLKSVSDGPPLDIRFDLKGSATLSYNRRTKKLALEMTTPSEINITALSGHVTQGEVAPYVGRREITEFRAEMKEVALPMLSDMLTQNPDSSWTFVSPDDITISTEGPESFYMKVTAEAGTSVTIKATPELPSP